MGAIGVARLIPRMIAWKTKYLHDALAPIGDITPMLLLRIYFEAQLHFQEYRLQKITS